MEPPKKRREPIWRRPFINQLAETGNVALSAESVGIARPEVYKARQRNKGFAKDWDNAMERATDALEQEARRRGMDGVDEPVFFKGQVVGAVRKYSDTLLIFLLKAHRPKKFREYHHLEHASSPDQPLTVRVVYDDPLPEDKPPPESETGD